MVFITGTDTDVGKTLISAWICLHTGMAYWKPIQTGAYSGEEFSDSYSISQLRSIDIMQEVYAFSHISSPHIASEKEGITIDIDSITLPDTPCVIEGAGGVYVPINTEHYMIDLIQKMNVPVIIVSATKIGTINHTLLTIEALEKRGINILGVILNGEHSYKLKETIERYSTSPVIAEFPYLDVVSKEILLAIPFPTTLERALKKYYSF